MKRTIVLIYGIVCYVLFLGTFLYAIGFLSNRVVPKSIDSGAAGTSGAALVVDCVLLGLFAVQHSVMARQRFKRAWTAIVSAEAERSTYVLASSLVLALVFWQWLPMVRVFWDVRLSVARIAIESLYWLGCLIVLVSSFLTDHFDLFGLRQVYLYARGRAYTPVGFKKVGLYRYVRHPIMLGFLIAFWAAPTMTAGHFVFSLASTLYVLVGIQFEERDLVQLHGEAYRQYQRETSMLVPLPPAGDR